MPDPFDRYNYSHPRRRPWPAWAEAHARRVLAGRYYPRLLHFFLHADGNNGSIYGMAYPGSGPGDYGDVKVFAPTLEETPRATYVVLHELAHALDHLRHGNAPDMVGTRNSGHGPRWRAIAVEVYRPVPGVLRYAAYNAAYACERKACRAALLADMIDA